MLVFLGGAVKSRLIGNSGIGAGVIVAAIEFIRNRKRHSKQYADPDLQ